MGTSSTAAAPVNGRKAPLKLDYDGIGNLTSVTDQLERVAGFEFDPRNLQTAIVDAAGNRVEYEYDELGNITTTTEVTINNLFTRGDQGVVVFRFKDSETLSVVRDVVLVKLLSSLKEDILDVLSG